MLNSRQRLGKIGEQAVAKFLKKYGYKILAQNYRCKLGEIDIIAKDGPVLVFIEVKTRSGTSYGCPAAAVNMRKQRQISKAAQCYLAEHSLFDSPARFDVVSVLCDHNNNHHFDHINNAFDLCE
ncbi:MAG: YraN family protein [Desulfobulbaceae bacterium]|nr:YraN family protein [Desulfobulbaceae bacterium]